MKELNIPRQEDRDLNFRLLLTFGRQLGLGALVLMGSGFALAQGEIDSVASARGEIRGVTQRPDRQAVPDVQILVHGVNGAGDRTVSSDRHGAFSVSGLSAGVYEVTATDADKIVVEVGAGSSIPVELTLRESGQSALMKELESMRKRIEELEAQLKKTEVTTVAAEAKPAPIEARPGFVLPRVRPVDLTPEWKPAPVIVQTAVVAPEPVPAATAAPPVDLPTQTPAPAPVPQTDEKKGPPDPFSFADFTWLTGNPRTSESPLDTKVFTGELRVDTEYTYDMNHPADHTIGGSSEIFRSGEVQLTQFGIGGDFHWNNIRARLMTQFGMYAETTPRNDASPARGAWDLDTAYRYISEAYGGYHFNVLNGINVDAGIFMSYVGLFSYYQFDNWAYQPSYVSSNTPWFFNGVRVQIFPTQKLKIEPWFVNGWQSYGTFNKSPGLGMQILYRPNSWLSILGNQYEGTDALGIPGRHRVHTDDSIQIKYYDKPGRLLDKAAMTITADAGCEFGQNSGVSCRGGTVAKPSQYFLGFMVYERAWFHRDMFAVTVGGGAINNPGRYLVLLPPINGATAITGTPYFTENPGDPYKAWDTSATFDYMPKQFITWRFEYNHRASNVPYFSGNGGITPPGGDNGSPSLFVPGWSPDLRKRENRITIALLVKL